MSLFWRGMIRSLLSLMLAVAFAFQGMSGCAMVETAVAAPRDHCAEVASQPDGSAHHAMPDADGAHDCKHSCHLPAIASAPSIVADPSVSPEIAAVAVLAVRHGGQLTPAIPPPRTA